MPRSMPEVLLVSRPVSGGPPDGTVELVRTLASTGGSSEAPIRFGLLKAWGPHQEIHGAVTLSSALPGGVAWRPVTLLRLLQTPPRVIRHYFFTPTNRVVALLRIVHRLRPAPAVQTICSTPGDDVSLGPLIFASHVVALSSHTRDRLLGEGLPPGRVHLIPPAVPTPPPVTDQLRAEVRRRLGLAPGTAMLVYLGDFDVAGAALSTARAIGPLLGREGLALVLACRPKGGRHREVAQEVRDALATSGARPGQVLILGRISFAPALAAAADLAIFPARRLPDKMDLPLGLLQSLAAGVPALVANEGPLADLVNAGAAFGVDARDPEALRTAALHLLEDGKQRRALGAAARRHMEREGSVTELGRAHAALYGRLWRQ